MMRKKKMMISKIRRMLCRSRVALEVSFCPHPRPGLAYHTSTKFNNSKLFTDWTARYVTQAI